MEKMCTNCGTLFVFSEQESNILASISPVLSGQRYAIPVPDECGRCRMRNVMCYQNEIHLFKATCVASGQEVITIYNPKSGHKVMEQSLWYSDTFDGMKYGRKYDFDRPFFEQFHNMNREIPKMNISVTHVENSPYISAAGHMKNCYLVTVAEACDNVYYGHFAWNVRNSMDLVQATNVENCYEVVDCLDCYQCYFTQDSKKCQNSYFLFDCRNCDSCIGCVGLRNKQYYIYNKQATKEEYEQLVAKMKNASYRELQHMRTQFANFVASQARKYINGEQNQDVTGNYVQSSKNCLRTFDTRDSENIFDCDNVFQTKDCISIYTWGAGLELAYYCAEVGSPGRNVAFCVSSWHANTNLYYSQFCISCKDCFGCSNLKNKQYCIFNTQYTKEEYEALVPKIIAHMQRTGEWGHFFPSVHSPFAYNESVADRDFPLTKEEIEHMGLVYREKDQIAYRAQTDVLDSDRIGDVDESILKKILTCEISGKPYRIIPQEYAFYLKHSLPIPRICFEEREKQRMGMRSKKILQKRSCASCTTIVETAYDHEKVLCETCYLKQVG